MSRLLLETDHRERSDAYAGEIFRSGNWRVALCRDHLQFLVQQRRRAPGNPATAAWDNVSFCQTRAALLRVWRALMGEDGEALLGLPDHEGLRAEAPLLGLSCRSGGET